MSQIRIRMRDEPSRYESVEDWSWGAKAALLRSRIARECWFCKREIPASEPHYGVNAFMYYRVCQQCGEPRKVIEA